MNKTSTIIMPLLFHIALSHTAAAQQSPSPEKIKAYEEYTSQKHQKNLTGWKSVFFYCSIRDEENKSLTEICDNSYRNAAFLAAAAKVPFIKARDAFDLGFRAAADDYLVLEVELFSTRPTSPSAIHAHVKSYIHYSNAVQPSPNQRGDKGRTIPRSGDLHVWERPVIGASTGTTQDLVPSISQGIEKILKEFFTDYINSQD